MKSAAMDRVPAPVRRVAAFVVVGVVVYALFLVIGSLVFPPAVSAGPTYALSSTIAAGIAAFYLVYLRGFARIRDLLR